MRNWILIPFQFFVWGFVLARDGLGKVIGKVTGKNPWSGGYGDNT